jgi:hypothetical protein
VDSLYKAGYCLACPNRTAKHSSADDNMLTLAKHFGSISGNDFGPHSPLPFPYDNSGIHCR